MSKCFNRDCAYCKDCVCTFNNGKNIKECHWYQSEIKTRPTTDFVDLLNKEMYELKISDLEAKLAESEIKYAQLRVKQLEKDAKKYKNADKELLGENINLKDKVRELKQQLAEKEELKLRIKKLDKLYSEALETVDSLFTNQDKISFAVEQINKLKNDLYENEKINIRACDFDEIDNIFETQIKQLKEMK